MRIKQPFVSILTPVFNGEKFIEECIKSVVSQTYKNFEYIIVNNCSTDKTFDIAKSYADKDSRIKIHNNKRHLPLLQNLNHTFLQMSKDSKYCKVIHADDWLYPECIEKMVEVAEKNPRVGIVSSYLLEGKKTESFILEDRQIKGIGLSYDRNIFPGREICRLTLLGQGYFFGSPSTLLIRSDIIRKRVPFYSEDNIHTDFEVCLDILREWDFGFVHQVLSFSRVHDNAHSSFAKRVNTYILEGIKVIEKYGSVYLSDDEYKEIMNKKMKYYYRFLGKSIFKNRKKEFWTFHINGLKEMGKSINILKLFLSFILVIYNKIISSFIIS